MVRSQEIYSSWVECPECYKNSCLAVDFISSCVRLFPIHMLSFETEKELEISFERKNWEWRKKLEENTKKVGLRVFKAKGTESQSFAMFKVKDT